MHLVRVSATSIASFFVLTQINIIICHKIHALGLGSWYYLKLYECDYTHGTNDNRIVHQDLFKRISALVPPKMFAPHDIVVSYATTKELYEYVFCIYILYAINV